MPRKESARLFLSDQQRLVHGILTSLTSALRLVVDGREHHALCVRSFSMVEMYEKDWPLFYYEKWATYDQERKDHLKRWYEWIKITAQSAAKQKDGGYTEVMQRSVIFLADVLENLTESFLQICHQYIDDKVIPVQRVTGRRPRDMKDPGDIKRSVRVWERSLKIQSRLGRFVTMIQRFFPQFSFPAEKQQNLDAMISARNAFTHELIVVSPIYELGDDPPRAAPVTDGDVQRYFDDVGAYVIALMDAFKETAAGE